MIALIILVSINIVLNTIDILISCTDFMPGGCRYSEPKDDIENDVK